MIGGLLRRADDGEGLQHLIGDERAHLLPLALHGHLVQAGGEAAPAVDIEHALIGAGGAVEGDALGDLLLAAPDLGVGVADDDEAAAEQLDIGEFAACLAGADLEVGQEDVGEVLGAEERVGGGGRRRPRRRRGP